MTARSAANRPESKGAAGLLVLPRSEVRPGFLFHTDTLTFCPYKGIARYFGVRANGRELRDAL
jgi:uncharacterized protein (DUF427 family)